jgi:transposase-like protein
MRLARAAEIVESGIDETLSYYSMPSEHWRCLRTNNPLERLMREIRRRTRVVGAFLTCSRKTLPVETGVLS